MNNERRPMAAHEPRPEGHAPKAYSNREQAVFAAKLLAITGALVAVLWLLEKSL